MPDLFFWLSCTFLPPFRNLAGGHCTVALDKQTVQDGQLQRIMEALDRQAVFAAEQLGSRGWNWKAVDCLELRMKSQQAFQGLATPCHFYCWWCSIRYLQTESSPVLYTIGNKSLLWGWISVVSLVISMHCSMPLLDCKVCNQWLLDCKVCPVCLWSPVLLLILACAGIPGLPTLCMLCCQRVLEAVSKQLQSSGQATWASNQDQPTKPSDCAKLAMVAKLPDSTCDYLRPSCPDECNWFSLQCLIFIWFDAYLEASLPLLTGQTQVSTAKIKQSRQSSRTKRKCCGSCDIYYDGIHGCVMCMYAWRKGRTSQSFNSQKMWQSCDSCQTNENYKGCIISWGEMSSAGSVLVLSACMHGLAGASTFSRQWWLRLTRCRPRTDQRQLTSIGDQSWHSK